MAEKPVAKSITVRRMPSKLAWQLRRFAADRRQTIQKMSIEVFTAAVDGWRDLIKNVSDTEDLSGYTPVVTWHREGGE
jgi:hypothetical protein